MCERDREWGMALWLMCGGGGSLNCSERTRRRLHFQRTMAKRTLDATCPLRGGADRFHFSLYVNFH